jgi:hypothetical protein
MRRFILLMLVVGALLAAMAGPAAANSPARLSEAGWDCFDVPGLGVHCMPPGVQWGDPHIQLLYFDTSDPTATEAEFLGTESLVRKDAFKGNRQCRTDPSGGWLDLGELGYFACHRN